VPEATFWGILESIVYVYLTSNHPKNQNHGTASTRKHQHPENNKFVNEKTYNNEIAMRTNTHINWKCINGYSTRLI